MRRALNVVVAAAIIVVVLLLIQRAGKLATELCGDWCRTGLEGR